MKIYVINDSAKVLNDIKQLNSKVGLNIIGFGTFDPENIKNCSIMRADLLLISQIDEEEALNVFNACPQINVLMLANDLNRAQDLAGNLLKKGFDNFNFLSLNRFSLKDVLNIIKEQYKETNNKKNDSEKEYDIDAIPITFADEGENEVQNNSIDAKKETNGQKNDANVDSEKANVDKIDANSMLENDLNSNLKSFKKNDIPNFNPSSNLKTKVIHFHSKKGGVGKTFLCKEVGNVFASKKLPAKLKKDDDYLKTCLLDLDFERGSLRCQLGVLQAYPSVYDWIEDIVTLLEKGVPFNKIKYTSIQVFSQFARKVKNGLFIIPTAQGELPSNLYKRIEHLQVLGHYDDSVLKLICDKMIDSLKGIFDIVILDTPDGIGECSLSAYENSDVNVIVMEPTLSDFDATKVLLDEISNFNTINPNTLSLLINKDMPKTGLEEEIDEMFEFLTIPTYDFETGKKVMKALPLCSCVPFSSDVILHINNCSFITDGFGTVKQSILKICDFILPIFKTKMRLDGKTKASLLVRKQKKVISKKQNFAKEKEIKNIKKEDDTIIENAMNKVDERNKANNEIKKEVKNQKNKELVSDAKDDVSKPLNKPVFEKSEIYEMKFAKNVTLQEFVDTLRCVKNIRFLTNGIPYLEIKPAYLPKKVWKQYIKESLKDK